VFRDAAIDDDVGDTAFRGHQRKARGGINRERRAERDHEITSSVIRKALRNYLQVRLGAAEPAPVLHERHRSERSRVQGATRGDGQACAMWALLQLDELGTDGAQLDAHRSRSDKRADPAPAAACVSTSKSGVVGLSPHREAGAPEIRNGMGASRPAAATRSDGLVGWLSS